jgi:hypothetical protein
LTKCDLLTPTVLAGSIEIVKSDLNYFLDELDRQAQVIADAMKQNDLLDNGIQAATIPKTSPASSNDSDMTFEQRAPKLPMLKTKSLAKYPRLSFEECVIPVSASTGSGIAALWKSMADCVRQSVRNSTLKGEPLLPHAVREHVNANKLRRRAAAASLTRYKA